MSKPKTADVKKPIPAPEPPDPETALGHLSAATWHLEKAVLAWEDLMFEREDDFALAKGKWRKYVRAIDELLVSMTWATQPLLRIRSSLLR